MVVTRVLGCGRVMAFLLRVRHERFLDSCVIGSPMFALPCSCCGHEPHLCSVPAPAPVRVNTFGGTHGHALRQSSSTGVGAWWPCIEATQLNEAEHSEAV